MQTHAALNDTIGKLTLVEALPNHRNGYGRQWLCRCACGVTCTRVEALLRHGAKRGQTASCDCHTYMARARYVSRLRAQAQPVLREPT